MSSQNKRSLLCNSNPGYKSHIWQRNNLPIQALLGSEDTATQNTLDTEGHEEYKEAKRSKKNVFFHIAL